MECYGSDVIQNIPVFQHQKHGSLTSNQTCQLNQDRTFWSGPCVRGAKHGCPQQSGFIIVLRQQLFFFSPGGIKNFDFCYLGLGILKFLSFFFFLCMPCDGKAGFPGADCNSHCAWNERQEATVWVEGSI